MSPLRKLLPGKRSSDEPLVVAAPSKKRSTLACEVCRQKKTKCDGVRPTCGACGTRASECQYTKTRNRHVKEGDEGSHSQQYACGNFLRLLRSGTEEHAVKMIRKLRAGDDVETILLDESFNCTSASSKLTSDALHFPSQDFVIAYEERKYSVVPSGDLATQCRRNTQLGKEVVLQEIVDHLRGMPDNAAERLLGELRSTTNTTSVLRLIRGSILRKSLSEQSTARSLLPALHSQMELELMVRYPKAYPALDRSQDSGLLQGLSGGILDTSEHSPWKSDPIHTWESYERPVPKALYSLPPADLPARPHTIASNLNEDLYFNSSLSQLNIGFWTNVEVTNHVAASAISLYLETDHPMCGFFNANLFIRDLVQLNLEHCSAFLVSSLLAFACTIYAAKDAHASDLSQRFQEEAAVLWEVERKADTLPALAGLGLLFLATLSHGKNSGALGYLEDFAEMARRLKLFDVTDRLTTADIASLPQEIQIATAQAAWATYNHLCMQSLLHWRTPVRIPPALPIPGTNLNDKVDVQVDSIFTAHCYFWVIASDTISVFRNFKASVAFAYARYHKLLEWTNLLYGIMIRGTHNEAHVLIFHMFLHAIIMDIFRPFVQEEKQHGFRTWQTKYDSPEAIFATSLKQLKSLVLCIEKQSPLTAMWHVALLYVATAALKDTKDPEWRFYFVTCIESYQKMYRSFPVMSMAVQGLLTLALRKKAITTGEARDLMYKVPAIPREPDDAKFVLDMDLVLKTSEDAKVNNIARDFDDLVLFEEFIEHPG